MPEIPRPANFLYLARGTVEVIRRPIPFLHPCPGIASKCWFADPNTVERHRLFDSCRTHVSNPAAAFRDQALVPEKNAIRRMGTLARLPFNALNRIHKNRTGKRAHPTGQGQTA